MRSMRNTSIAVLALGLAVILMPGHSANYAYGEDIAVGTTTFPGIDLSQAFAETCPACVANGAEAGSFTGIDMFIETTGVTFSDVNGISDGGWSGSLVNSQFEQLTGEATSSLGFDVDLNDPVAAVLIDFYAMQGDTVVDSATFAYPGTGPYGWDVISTSNNPGSISDENTSPTPEPSSLMLLGTGFLGLVGVMRRKLS